MRDATKWDGVTRLNHYWQHLTNSETRSSVWNCFPYNSNFVQILILSLLYCTTFSHVDILITESQSWNVRYNQYWLAMLLISSCSARFGEPFVYIAYIAVYFQALLETISQLIQLAIYSPFNWNYVRFTSWRHIANGISLTRTFHSVKVVCTVYSSQEICFVIRRDKKRITKTICVWKPIITSMQNALKNSSLWSQEFDSRKKVKFLIVSHTKIHASWISVSTMNVRYI